VDEIAVSERLVTAAAGGDAAARDELVRAFAPTIATFVERYASNGRGTRRQLTDAGAVGVLRALERYDDEIGGPFGAYACWWIRHAMLTKA